MKQEHFKKVLIKKKTKTFTLYRQNTLPNEFISSISKSYHRQSSRSVVHMLQKEMWSDEATVTSEQVTFY